MRGLYSKHALTPEQEFWEIAIRLKQHEEQQRVQNMSAVEFITQKLGEHLWTKQREIADAITNHRYVAVHSAHCTGKSWLAARIIAWWIESHPYGEAFALTTAPTYPQVRAILWRELNKAHRKGKLSGDMNLVDWSINGELVALGRKPSDYDEDAFQGIHNKYVLVAIDEACGIAEQLWVASSAIATNEYSKILAIGNPDNPLSHFARICQPYSGWHVIGISVFDSPNLTGEAVPEEVKDNLVSQGWVEERKKEWGEDDPRYVSKVLGEFPEDLEHGVIPYSWVKACQAELPSNGSDRVELGFDVSAGGDDAVIRERVGMKAGRSWSYREPDTMVLTGKVVKIIKETGASAIKIDKIGIGQGVYDRLREVARQDPELKGCKIIGVCVADASTRPSEFPKLRDEIWWMGRELCETGAWDLSEIDNKVIRQLIAPVWKPDSAGRVQVEKKDDTKKRIGRSTDDADALLLAFYVPQVKKVRFSAI